MTAKLSAMATFTIRAMESTHYAYQCRGYFDAQDFKRFRAYLRTFGRSTCTLAYLKWHGIVSTWWRLYFEDRCMLVKEPPMDTEEIADAFFDLVHSASDFEIVYHVDVKA